MKRTLRQMLCISLAIMMVLLAGCTGSSSVKEPTDQQTKAESTSPANPPANPKDLSGEFTVWFWDNAAIKNGIDDFYKAYPNIKINCVDIAGSEQVTTKILSSLAAGTELPDMGCIEMGYRYKLISTGIWENLEKEPYNLDRTKMLDYLIPINSDENGNIVAIDSLICSAGYGYKKPLAKKYFGTDNPDELEKMFPTWDAMLQKGIELKKQYPDMFFFATDEDVFRIAYGQNNIEFESKDEDFSIEAFKDAVHWVCEFKKAGLVDNALMWTPGWYGTFADDVHVFCACASWMPHYQIKENDPNYKGRWGLMLPPGGGVNWGGTSYAIYSGSKVKDLVWAYIQWALMSEDGAASYKATNGFYSPYKPMYDNPDYFFQQTDAFGTQNIGDLLYNRILKTIQMRKISKYDSAVIQGFTQWFQDFDISHDKLTEEEVLKNLETGIRNNISE